MTCHRFRFTKAGGLLRILACYDHEVYESTRIPNYPVVLATGKLVMSKDTNDVFGLVEGAAKAPSLVRLREDWDSQAEAT